VSISDQISAPIRILRGPRFGSKPPQIAARTLGVIVALAGAAMLLGYARAEDLFSAPGATVRETRLDRLVREGVRNRGLSPAQPCSDAVFLRRVYLDVVGRPPTPDDVDRFLADTSPQKREQLIDTLLADDDFALLSAMRWCDTLRVKSEFPVNLWPNAVQAYHRWIFESLREDLPYDRFAAALVTASGSNFRVAPANFFRALPERTPRGAAMAVALTFFGKRWESVEQPAKERLEAIFSGIAYKSTAEWKEEIVYFTPQDHRKFLLPDGTPIQSMKAGDPRPAFARWMVGKNNAAFGQVAANRVWTWLFGRGIVHEPDDFRPDNPPGIPGLLEHLGTAFAGSGYDLRALHKMILVSATYQQSCVPAKASPDAERYFACYPARPLPAEVLVDTICQVTGTSENYMSLIPEPFTFLTGEKRTVGLADGSITSPFLDLLGRPPRDTGLFSERGGAPTDEARRYLLNSRHIQSKLSKSPAIRALAQGKPGPKQMVELIYLHFLSRPPSRGEFETALAYLSAGNKREAIVDLAWALMNSKEFLFQH
jgi:hypothetical protein